MKKSSKLPFVNFTLIIVIGCLTFALYEREYVIDKTPRKTTQEAATKSIKGIAKVVDGDTIKIYNERVRLVGIDAPESKQKCFDKNGKEYFCGKMSTNFLKEIADQKIVECFYEKRDFYKRYLGNCYLGKVFLNLEMVRNGMAVIYDYKNSSQDFIDAKNSAQENEVGIWQGAFELPKNYRKRVKR